MFVRLLVTFDRNVSLKRKNLRIKKFLWQGGVPICINREITFKGLFYNPIGAVFQCRVFKFKLFLDRLKEVLYWIEVDHKGHFFKRCLQKERKKSWKKTLQCDSHYWKWSIGLYWENTCKNFLMPSPSAFSKFVLSALKFLSILKFLRCTQNSFGTLKWANLCREI